MKGLSNWKACALMVMGLWVAAVPSTVYGAEMPPEKEVIMRIGSPLMFVNMNEVQLDSVPVVRNNRTYLPLRPLVENLGAEVVYHEGTPMVEVHLKDKKVALRTDSTVFEINGQPHVMPTAPFVNGDARTMVPVRVVSEGLGFAVAPLYDDQGKTRSVVIKNME